MYKLLTIVIIILSVQNLNAQKFDLGGELGYGRAISITGFEFDELFGVSGVNNLRVGINSSMKLPDSILRLSSGLNYNHIWDNEASMNIIKIPMGVEGALGGKSKFILGGGFNVSYLFLMSGNISNDFKETKRDFQFGYYLNSSYRFYLNNKWYLFLKLQWEMGLTKLYEDSYPCHFGGCYENAYLIEYSLSLGFKYKILQKKVN